MHALVDGEGMPLKIGLTAGERHDMSLGVEFSLEVGAENSLVGALA